jgi:hypothetical protein
MLLRQRHDRSARPGHRHGHRLAESARDAARGPGPFHSRLGGGRPISVPGTRRGRRVRVAGGSTVGPAAWVRDDRRHLREASEAVSGFDPACRRSPYLPYRQVRGRRDRSGPPLQSTRPHRGDLAETLKHARQTRGAQATDTPPSVRLLPAFLDDLAVEGERAGRQLVDRRRDARRGAWCGRRRGSSAGGRGRRP